jgi:hypothetical protein
MPRTISSLGGLEAAQAQIPVSLIRLEITGDEKRIHDLDLSLWLNPTTNAVAMAGGVGLLEFTPYAGLEVPQIDVGDAEPFGDVVVTLSNVDGDWSDVMADNAYRNATATIWQGNLSLAVGASPFGVAFQGVVTMWTGKLVFIEANLQTAQLYLEPPDPFAGPLPWRTYTAPDFKDLPTPGTRIKWGWTDREV